MVNIASYECFVRCNYFILYFIFSTDPILAGIRRLEKLVMLSVGYLLFGMIGALIGLLVAWLVGLPFTNLQIPAITQSVPIALGIIFGYLGFLCRNDAS